jgi:N-acylneuraminate cytidylyltransferase
VSQARNARSIDSVWVSSDSEEILSEARKWGALPIERPAELASDTVSSEAAWLHAIDFIESSGVSVDRVVGIQATSPLREPRDLDDALAQFERERLDSLVSVVEIRDFFVWRRSGEGLFEPVNYDYRSRRRRQAIEPQFRENGSFYVFRPSLLRSESSRLGGRIGAYIMAPHKIFQIDDVDDLRLCEIIMKGYGLDRA